MHEKFKPKKFASGGRTGSGPPVRNAEPALAHSYRRVFRLSGGPNPASEEA